MLASGRPIDRAQGETLSDWVARLDGIGWKPVLEACAGRYKLNMVGGAALLPLPIDPATPAGLANRAGLAAFESLHHLMRSAMAAELRMRQADWQSTRDARDALQTALEEEECPYDEGVAYVDKLGSYLLGVVTLLGAEGLIAFLPDGQRPHDGRQSFHRAGHA